MWVETYDDAFALEYDWLGFPPELRNPYGDWNRDQWIGAVAVFAADVTALIGVVPAPANMPIPALMGLAVWLLLFLLATVPAAMVARRLRRITNPSTGLGYHLRTLMCEVISGRDDQRAWTRGHTTIAADRVHDLPETPQ